ncbi:MULTISPECIES: hypothetical protein [Sphingomonas]|uniref:hypothetical protein n=1 Tax=Sphingomonas TaxID=13687 RepID=UPI000F7DCAE3|nr:hypothetical protein [Sphingomonas sp. ABOLF]RSV14629.1 hypothetical protein CA235_11155 [Sphingomonas sp. ABOLF]GLK19230.1 hypothetical protein GCM10017606_00560 [Microbacterium terregens]
MKRAMMRGLIALALTAAPCAANAQSAGDYWATKPNRIKIAGALNHWADFCSNVFYFERAPKLANEALEPKINSHLLLSSTPSIEVERWAGWLPYADPDSEIAKPTHERAADALLAARADPSSAAAAEKLFVDTMRGYFKSVYAKCREGAGDEWIAHNLYSGAGDFERAMATVKIDFAQSVKDIDKPDPKPDTRRAVRKR